MQGVYVMKEGQLVPAATVPGNKGDKGDKGDQGDQGPQGIAGVLLIENGATVPPETPVGTLIFEKAI